MKKVLILGLCGVLILAGIAWAAPALKNLQAIFQQGQALIGLQAPMWVDAEVVSTADVPHTVPTGAHYVMFSGTGNFYVRYDAAAAIPAGAVTDGSAPELNPVLRDIWNVKVIHLIAPSSCVVTIATWK